MGIYSVDKIKNWYDDFASEYNVYNKYYSDFKNSYINICHATTIANMNKKLDEHYSRIKRINSRVDKLWKKYIEDLEAVDKKLAGQKASFNDSTLAAKASKLPELKEYKVTFSTKINSLSTSAGIIKSIGWSEEKTSSENLKNSLEMLLASGAVVVTSVVSGMGKLAEEFKDGLLWLDTAVISGTATLFGAKEWANNFQNKMMKVINFDAVGKANEVFYEKTEIGKRINEKSLLKYDSKAAQGIQSVSTKATEIALATALTVATAGASAPVSALIVGSEGFLIGAGEKAQESFKNNDGNFWESSKEIVVAGGAKAIEFYSEGQMGAGAINAVGTVKSAGGIKNIVSSIKPVLFNGESSLFTKESLKNGLKTTFKDVDTYMDSLGAAFDNIKYDNKNGIQIDWSGLAKETACNLAMNSTFGFLSNGFETRRISGMKNLELNANKSDVNIDSLKKEYDELIGWRNSDKFLTDEAYYKTYGDKIGGNSYKKNIERISELENALDIKKARTSSNTITANTNIDSLKKEYNELVNKTKEDWFIKAKEASDNGWAWDLNKVDEADNIAKRMQELENTLGIKNSSLSESKIYDYSQAKKEADAMVQKIKNKPIPGFENIDTNSQEYKKAMQEFYSKPNASGRQSLDGEAFNSKQYRAGLNEIETLDIKSETDLPDAKKSVMQKLREKRASGRSVKMFAEYNGNLRSYISDGMPKKLNNVEKARYIYCKLNNEVSYSSKWNSRRVVNIDVEGIYGKKIDLSNYNGDEIVCSNWAEMYAELLRDNGINCTVRGGDKIGSHKWVVFESDGKHYMADATNRFSKVNDLTRMQSGAQSYGFIEITKEQAESNSFANNISEVIAAHSNSRLDVKKIDKKTGFNYEDADSLFSDKLKNGNSPKELKHLGLDKNATVNDIVEAKLEKELFKKMDNMGVIEGLTYCNKRKFSIFTPEEMQLFNEKWIINKKTGEMSVLYTVSGGKNYLYNGKNSSFGTMKVVDDDFANNYLKHGFVDYR